MRLILSLLATTLAILSAAAADTPPKPPEGQPVRLAVTRDTWVSAVGDEARCNLGGAPKLKFKSAQEMTLLDVDPAPLRGRVITGAVLHLRSTGEPRVARVTVGSLGADWVEGTAETYKPQDGSSSFRFRRNPDVPWAQPGSDICSVILGQGGTTWRMADASAPDPKGWQQVPVDPAVVAARVAGLSYGFLVFDDTGSEWEHKGDKFTPHPFPNRFVYSREAGANSAPYMVVYLGDKDTEPPAAPTELKADATDLPPGEVWLSWVTPVDKGPAGTLGFLLTVDGREVPRYLIPLAGKPGDHVRMRLRDLGLKGGAKVEVRVWAVDAAGNVGEPAVATVTVSDHVAPALPGSAAKPFTKAAALPKLGGAEVAILDELDKVDPVKGTMIPEQPADYLSANHLWSAAEHEVDLYAARNEFVSFQVLLRGAIEGVRPELTFPPEAKGVQATFGRYAYVAAPQGPLPDPVLPLEGAFAVPTPTEKIAEQKNGSLHAEVYVPHTTPAGTYVGELVLKAGDNSLKLKVKLRVWDFTLPDYLSFLPEMNCYGLPANERDYYRLAHKHRTVLNRVPYSQSGNVADGCAPAWDGKQLDWTAWDKRFGGYFDGSAFADLPRRGVPLECYYLPLHENWPSPMAGNYNDNYWADHSFPARYREDFVKVSRLFAEHFNQHGWQDTLFVGFLNDKVNYKEKGWSRGASPWLLDEPMNFQDYWALRYFGAAFHEGVQQSNSKAKMVFRADISRPQWQRDSLDGLLDYAVVGSSLRRYHRMVLDRKEAQGQIVLEYGGTNAITESNMQPVGWCVDIWALGCNGVEPWQTIGRADSWNKADPLALFYPARGGKGEPVPSVRLKAYRRGQQDVEYLTLLRQLLGQPRWAVGQRVREALHLAGTRTGTGYTADEDAGVMQYRKLLPQELWALRVQVGAALSDAHPEPKRRLVELRTPPRDPSRLPPGQVSGRE